MKIATHSGVFHADDIFALGVLTLKFPEAEIIRTRDEEKIKGADVVVDVGKVYDPAAKRFDHHQPEGAGKHPNGIPYASFGLVWKEYGEELAGSKEVFEVINEKLVSPIDALDNGVLVCVPVFEQEQVREYSISDFFYSYFDHMDMSEEHIYKTFLQVVEIARGILRREIDKAEKRVQDNERVKQILKNTKDKGIIVLEERLAWKDILVPDPDTRYVVFPRVEGNWGVKCVPLGTEDFSAKKLLPESWAGKDGEDLVAITGVPDAVFCHSGRFIAAAKTKEGALALANLALNQ